METGLIPDLFLSVSSVVSLGISTLVALVILSRRPPILTADEKLLSKEGLYAIVGNPFSSVYQKVIGVGLVAYELHENAEIARHNYEVDARNKAAVGDYQRCLRAGGN
jgi:hypothetical protein